MNRLADKKDDSLRSDSFLFSRGSKKFKKKSSKKRSSKCELFTVRY